MTNRMFTWVGSITVVVLLLTGCSESTPTGTNSPHQKQESPYQTFTPQEVEQAKKMTAEYFARFEAKKITTQAEMRKDILSNFRGHIKDIYTDAPGRFLEVHESVIQHKPKPGQDEKVLELNYRHVDYSPWGHNGDKYWMYKGSIPKLDKFEVFEFPDPNDQNGQNNFKRSTLEVWSADGEYWTEIVKGKSGLLFYTTSILSEQFKPLKRAHNSGKKDHPVKGGDY